MEPIFGHHVSSVLFHGFVCDTHCVVQTKQNRTELNLSFHSYVYKHVRTSSIDFFWFQHSSARLFVQVCAVYVCDFLSVDFSISYVTEARKFLSNLIFVCRARNVIIVSDFLPVFAQPACVCVCVRRFSYSILAIQ